MYELRLYATIDEQKHADYLQYLHNKSLIISKMICNRADLMERTKDLENTVKELQWLTKH